MSRSWPPTMTNSGSHRTAGRHLAITALIIAAMSLAPPSQPARATGKLPLWELGAGLFLVSLPAYPGAKTYLSYLLPYPYIVYRGRKLRTTRTGISGIFVSTPRVQFDVSASAAPPVNSHDSPARSGMPNLEPVFQIGPQIKIHLYADQRLKLDLHLAVRSAQTIHFRSIGWVASPYLTLKIKNWRDSGWNLSMAAGPNFADHRYNQYYYGVAKAYAGANRPAYQAPAGYAGTAVYLGAGRAMGRLRLGAYISYTSLQNAAFTASPLVRTRQDFTAGLRIAWVFAESKRSAPSPD